MGLIFVDAVLRADTWAKRLVTTKCSLLREKSLNKKSILDVTPHTLSSTGCPKINETHKIANKYVDFNPIVYIFQI